MKYRVVILFLVVSQIFYAQNNPFFKKSDSLNIQKRKVLLYSGLTTYGVSMLGLNQLWYAKYPRSHFHTINDNKEWLQMDKIGHMMTSYYVGKIGMELLDWSGESKKNQLLFGSSLGFVFLTTVEVMDGFSKEWGFSTGDMLANLSGTGLLVGQELLWNEQRILLKYSFHQTDYAFQNPDLLGANFMEQTLKDYNGQTYWLSVNIWSFNKKSKFPKWLNVAFGYGAEGMLHGNNIPMDNRYRQFYLSLDVDLTKIKTKSKFLKLLFNTVNFIKIPAPALVYSNVNKWQFLGVYF